MLPRSPLLAAPQLPRPSLSATLAWLPCSPRVRSRTRLAGKRGPTSEASLEPGLPAWFPNLSRSLVSTPLERPMPALHPRSAGDPASRLAEDVTALTLHHPQLHLCRPLYSLLLLRGHTSWAPNKASPSLGHLLSPPRDTRTFLHPHPLLHQQLCSLPVRPLSSYPKKTLPCLTTPAGYHPAPLLSCSVKLLERANPRSPHPPLSFNLSQLGSQYLPQTRRGFAEG